MVTAAELKKKARALPSASDSRPFVRTIDSGDDEGHGGRPQLIVDLEAVRPLARIQCTIEEIAAVLGVSVMVLRNTPNFLETYREIADTGRKSLRRKIWKKAMRGKGNPALLVWLSKQHLGMHEPGQKVTVENTGDIDVNHIHTLQIDPEQFQAAVAVLAEAGALRMLPAGIVDTDTRIIDAEATVE